MQVILRDENSRDLQTRTNGKGIFKENNTESGKKIVQHGNFHVECGFKYWGMLQKEKWGKWELTQKVEGGNRVPRAVIDQDGTYSLERADLRGYH